MESNYRVRRPFDYMIQAAQVWLMVVVSGCTLLFPPSRVAAADRSALQGIVDQRLAFYNDAFPEIQFVQLPGGSQALASARVFSQLLGAGASNADYEHPPALREDLLYVTAQRVAFMLRNNDASSALFRPGRGSASTRPYLCVLTLDPAAVALDDRTATAHLLHFSAEELKRIPAAYRLGHETFLRFVVDHELFHCLDARFNGPIPTSDRTFWAQYMLYRNEHGADAFATAMHLRDHGRATPFVDNILRIRGLSLYNADPEHLTCAAISAVAQEDGGAMRTKEPRDIVALADLVRNRVAPDYNGYLRFRAAACRVMEEIGVPAVADDPLCKAAPPNEQAYRNLRDTCAARLSELLGE